MGIDTLLHWTVFLAFTLLLCVRAGPRFPYGGAVLVTVAMVLRGVFAIVLSEAFPLDDELGYRDFGLALLESYRGGLTAPDLSKNIWAHVTALFLWVFGEESLALRFFNSFLGVSSCVLLYRTSLALGYGAEHSARLFRFLLFLPPVMYVSVLALKEQAICFCLCLLVYGFVCQHRFRLLLMLLAYGGTALIRADLAVMLIPVGVGHLLYSVTAARFERRGSARLVTIFCVIGLGVLSVFAIMKSSLFESTKIGQILSGEDVRGEEVLSQSRATYASYIDLSNPWSVQNLLIPPVNFLYSPTPLRLFSVPNASVYVEVFALTLVIYWFTPYFLLGLRYCAGHHRHFFVCSVYLTVYLAASYSIFSAGPEPFRYRWPGLILFFFIAFLGRLAPWVHRRAFLVLWWSSVVVFSVVYLRSAVT